MINLIENHQKSVTVENANVKFFFHAEYKTVLDKNLPYSTQFHTHSYVELFACIKGELKIHTHNELIILTSGDVAAVPSSVYHFKEATVGRDVEWCGIGFICHELYSPHNSDVYSFFSDIMESDSVQVYRNREKLCGLFKECYGNRNENEISSVLSVTAEILRLPEIQTSVAARIDSSRKAKNIDRLLKLEDIINTRFYTNFSNKEIADSLFISERQLSRIVYENYSTSLRSLFIKKRLEVATELILTTSESIEKIVNAVGFKNKNSFNREFKRQYGVTPTEYRRNAELKY